MDKLKNMQLPAEIIGLLVTAEGYLKRKRYISELRGTVNEARAWVDREGRKAPRIVGMMKCPACGRKLTEHYNTIFSCEYQDCVMFHAILERKQWEWVSRRVEHDTLSSMEVNQ